MGNTKKSVKIMPIGDRILVKHIDEAQDQVKGGIIIPDSAKDKPQEAKIIALGTGQKNENGKIVDFDVKVGDMVVISKYGGTEFDIEGEQYKIVRQDDILAILN